MNTNKLAYFVVLGVLAFGLSSEYQKGNYPALHRAVGVVENSLCRLATRAEHTLATARILTSRAPEEFRVDDEFFARQQAQVERVMAEHQMDIDRAMALRQAHLDCLQQKLDRMHLVVERAQFQRTRALERARVRLTNVGNQSMIMVCPKTGARITVRTDPSDLNISIPAIDVGDSF